MGDGDSTFGRARSDAVNRSLTRALSAPVRAMTRILGTPAGHSTTPRSDGGRSSIVDCALYVDGVRQPGDWSYADALRGRLRARTTPSSGWGCTSPTHAEMADIAETYELHELAVEDAVKAEQRPKLEQFGATHFLVLRTARYVEHERADRDIEVVETGQVMLFIGEKFVITVRHGDACRLAPVRADLESKQELLEQGPWAVAYAVTDQRGRPLPRGRRPDRADLDKLEERSSPATGPARSSGSTR